VFATSTRFYLRGSRGRRGRDPTWQGGLMPDIEESIVIARPREEVFAFMTASENVPLYNSNVVDYELVSGEERVVGAVAKGASKVAGRRLEWTTTLREVDEGKRTLIASTESKIPFTIEMRFEDDPGGTKVTFAQHTDSLGGFFGKLADPVVVKMYARDVHANLEKAKLLLES
jgi:uncharacterized membrane protein